MLLLSFLTGGLVLLEETIHGEKEGDFDPVQIVGLECQKTALYGSILICIISTSKERNRSGHSMLCAYLCTSISRPSMMESQAVGLFTICLFVCCHIDIRYVGITDDKPYTEILGNLALILA